MAGYRVCKNCDSHIERTVLDNNFCICPNCNSYLRYHARKRIQMLADPNSFNEWHWNADFISKIKDEKYKTDIEKAKEKHNLDEAVVCGEMTIKGERALVGVMDSRFMMASMGHEVGERISELFERAIKRKLPVIIFCCSGGARMQEGIISLMQMEKTSAMVKKHSDAGLLYISVLTNPTMGGVAASFAVLADILLAEKGAMIGFAGARVIEQNTGRKLPKGFQTAEFKKEHGFVDGVIEREKERDILAYLLGIHSRKKIKLKENRLTNIANTKNEYCLKPWEVVKLARCITRPTSLDYINNIFSDFYELYGDRLGGDDHAVVAGIATFKGMPVTVIGQQKGKRSCQDALYRNHGMPSPCGYRKALRLAKQAEKFGRPIVFLVDTIGAACGKEAEEDGQEMAIANLLYELSSLETPILSIIIGEGGSGGALAFAVANEVMMLENSVYSVITPEGYASILWRDSTKASEAAECMGMTSDILFNLHVVDKIIPEKEPITMSNMQNMCQEMSGYMTNFFAKYTRKSGKVLATERVQRFMQY